MANNREWTKFGLTSPPRNGNPMDRWHSDVLWVILENHEEARQTAIQVKTDLAKHPAECQTVKRVEALWTWGKVTIAGVGVLGTIAGLVYLALSMWGEKHG